MVGVHTSSEAYPNTKHRLEGLRGAFQVTEVNSPLWVEPGDGIRIASRQLHGGWRVLKCHVALMRRYFAMRPPLRAYVPYPAVIVLLLWSFLPRGLRPRWIVADAFISLYDTVVDDRQLLASGSWRARLLRWAERRAYSTADRIVVDTAENAECYARLFALPRRQFVPIPLSTNETDYRRAPYRAENNVCKVLFVGTLIPLHGIETITAAAALLAHRADIRFLLIGDGQESVKIQQALDAGLTNVEWDRNWRSPAELAAAIESADICLGVFGAGDKTQRVCPYKLYAYSAVGRAVVTADTLWVRSSTNSFGCTAFSVVPPSDPNSLALRISGLAQMRNERISLARNSGRFYTEKLGNQLAMSLLIPCLMEGSRQDDPVA